jgi:hypothetical protein
MSRKNCAFPETETYRNTRNGYMDRANGLKPQSTDCDYFRGYCQRLIDELIAYQTASKLAS